jgi:hypothetical protein
LTLSADVSVKKSADDVADLIVPITIVGPNGQLTMPIGPGSNLVANTNFIGPLPTDSVWNLSVSSDTEGAHLVLFGNAFSDAHQVFPQLGIQVNGFSWDWPGLAGLLEGEQATVTVELRESSGAVIDSGSVQMPWSVGAAGEAFQSSQTGGFTDTDRAALTATEESSALVSLYNFLSQENLTPVPTPGPVVVQLQTPVYGCIVRLTTIPDGLTPQTPDLQYWVKTLATVRVFSGNDLWIRAPIHTPTKITSFWGEHLLIGLAGIVTQGWLENLHMIVDFLPGVEGTVILLHLPP